jgi:hypothetical protein
MTRSAPTVPVAAAIDTFPFSRIMYGRTNSPARSGMIKIAAKPIHDTARIRRIGTSAMGARRWRQRVARMTCQHMMSAMYSTQLAILTLWKADAGGMSGSPPRSNVHANAAAMTIETASLSPCFRQKPWADLGWASASKDMRAAHYHERSAGAKIGRACAGGAEVVVQ